MQFSIYPNPTLGSFTIEGENISTSNITLINNLGQSIQFASSIKDNAMLIETSDLSPGVYSILIRTESKIVTKKLIIK